MLAGKRLPPPPRPAEGRSADAVADAPKKKRPWAKPTIHTGDGILVTATGPTVASPTETNLYTWPSS